MYILLHPLLVSILSDLKFFPLKGLLIFFLSVIHWDLEFFLILPLTSLMFQILLGYCAIITNSFETEMNSC